MVRSSIDANEFPWPRMVMHQPHYLDRSKQSPGSGYAITVQIPQTYEQSMKAGHIKG